MPTSDIYIIPHVCVRAKELAPRSVLDIGIGFGKYGFLMREFLDICRQRYQPEMWETRIDGIEIFTDYVGELQRLIYDNIYIGDALDCLRKLGDYALILLIDVIEHIEKKRGFELIELIAEKSDVAFISTPIKVKKTPVMKFGNKYEFHVSRWLKEELEQFGNVSDIPGKGTYLLEMKRQ